MRKHRTLLRRLWRNAPPKLAPMRVRWLDEEPWIINGDLVDENTDKPEQPPKTTPPVVDGKPNSK